MPLMAMGGIILPLTVEFEPTSVPLSFTVFQGVSIIGVKICSRQEYEDMFRFCARHKIRPMIQKYEMSVSGLNQAIEDLKGGKVRYRAVVVA